jgi:hypothetical protein
MSLNFSKTILSHIRSQKIINSEHNHFRLGLKKYQYFPWINLSKAQYRKHQSRYISS